MDFLFSSKYKRKHSKFHGKTKTTCCFSLGLANKEVVLKELSWKFLHCSGVTQLIDSIIY